MRFPYPLYVCDIGGTNTRVAMVREKGGAVDLLAHLKTANFPDLSAAVEAAAQNAPERPRSLIACGAGPVQGQSLHLTNAAWTIDGAAVAERLGLEQGLLLNDFEAQALALPALQPGWVKSIGIRRSEPDSTGARLILGPGTGLGVAALLTIEGRYAPLSSEAGHSDFGPVGAEEERIWPYLERVDGRVSAEAVISGPGLVRLHRARMLADGRPAPQIDGVALVDRAAHNRSGEEARTVRLFQSLTARFAGDMALAFLARGGVTLGGGVLPRMFDMIDADEFRAAFESKPPMDGLLRSITTELVVAPDAVLAGMAAIAANPERYALDYAARTWRPDHAA